MTKIILPKGYRKEKCDKCEGLGIHHHPFCLCDQNNEVLDKCYCPTCSATGNKPVKIIIEAGECDKCEGRGFFGAKSGRPDCRVCKGTGFIYPIDGEVVEICIYCGHTKEDYSPKCESNRGLTMKEWEHYHKTGLIKLKILSIKDRTNKTSESMAVEV